MEIRIRYRATVRREGNKESVKGREVGSWKEETEEGGFVCDNHGVYILSVRGNGRLICRSMPFWLCTSSIYRSSVYRGSLRPSAPQLWQTTGSWIMFIRGSSTRYVNGKGWIAPL